MIRFWILLTVIGFLQPKAFSQCLSTISTFPYNESFELSAGGWVAGGMNSDWAWGIPAKTIINTAAQGQKCWVTGGLTGSFYSFGQRSFVYSPCFNFTNIQRPYIQFKIWWDGENQYDGTVFQYSLNNGQTWQNVGSNADPVNCLNQHWFNTANINALSTLASPQQGWSGTAQATQGTCLGGNGSGGWVSASHCMNNLAGQPSVMFRFAFGAGTICNDFNGVAFDDITISESPAITSDFDFMCTSTPLQYQFTDASTDCPNVFSWHFGDPSSGANNTSSLQNPTHTFTTPGNYAVTLTVQGPCGQTASTTYTVSTLNLTVIGTNPSCAGNNGQITATGTNANGLLQYAIQPGGNSNNTGSFSNLTAGTYTITFSDAIGCSITKTISLVSPSSAVWSNVTLTDVSCYGGNNGRIQASATGGLGTLSYQLLPLGLNNNNGVFTDLSAGNYTVVAIDASSCVLNTTVVINQPNEIIWLENNFTRNACGATYIGFFTLKAQGGTGGFTYSILPGTNNNASGIFQVQQSGLYKLIAIDQSGCSLSMEKEVVEQDCCTQLFIPNAFTPNNDGRNDEFRLVNFYGSRLDVFNVYNRWGQAVFSAQHDEDRWDGKFKGMACESGTYFYKLEFTCLSNGKKYTYQGEVHLAR